AHLPIYAANFARAVEEINKTAGQNYEVRTLKDALETLVQNGKLKKQSSPLGDIYLEPVP
ncbi:MAG: hypothetical protein GX892_12355, partial [Thermoanaerobacteraceae bacterium]|nr:hypothetical protein [Thermoanaerobacteraceae bacterium]